MSFFEQPKKESKEVEKKREIIECLSNGWIDGIDDVLRIKDNLELSGLSEEIFKETEVKDAVKKTIIKYLSNGWIDKC